MANLILLSISKKIIGSVAIRNEIQKSNNTTEYNPAQDFALDILDLATPIRSNPDGTTYFGIRDNKSQFNENRNVGISYWTCENDLAAIALESTDLLGLTVTKKDSQIISNEVMLFVSQKITGIIGVDAATGNTMFQYSEDGAPNQIIYEVLESPAAIVAANAPSTVSGWDLDGNTNGSLKYIGTNDNFDFPIYTNGSQKAVVLKTGEVGINTPAPSTRLEISDNNAKAVVVSSRYQTGTSAPSGFVGRRANGTASSPTGSQVNDELSAFSAIGHDNAAGFSNVTGSAIFYASETFTNIAQGTSFKVGVTPNGTTSKIDSFWVTHSGNFKAIGFLTDMSNNESVNANTRKLRDSAGTVIVDWSNYQLNDNAGNGIIYLGSKQLYTAGGSESVNWQVRYNANSTGVHTIQWESCELRDAANATSVTWSTRKLIATDGVTTIMDWSLAKPTITDLSVGTGATGTFTTVDLKTVTVTNGIITSIV